MRYASKSFVFQGFSTQAQDVVEKKKAPTNGEQKRFSELMFFEAEFTIY